MIGNPHRRPQGVVKSPSRRGAYKISRDSRFPDIPILIPKPGRNGTDFKVVNLIMITRFSYKNTNYGSYNFFKEIQSLGNVLYKFF